MLQAMNAARQTAKPTELQLQSESTSAIFRMYLSAEDRKGFLMKLNERLHEGLTGYDSVAKHRMIPTDTFRGIQPLSTVELYSIGKSWAIMTEIAPKEITTEVSEHDVTFTPMTYVCTGVLEVLTMQTSLVGVLETRFQANFYLTQEMMSLIREIAIDCATSA